jgi:hypothetical protein
MADAKKRKGSGFQSLGLSEEVYRGIQRMGFRVRERLGEGENFAAAISPGTFASSSS